LAPEDGKRGESSAVLRPVAVWDQAESVDHTDRWSVRRAAFRAPGQFPGASKSPGEPEDSLNGVIKMNPVSGVGSADASSLLRDSSLRIPLRLRVRAWYRFGASRWFSGFRNWCKWLPITPVSECASMAVTTPRKQSSPLFSWRCAGPCPPVGPSSVPHAG